jgi:mannan endo-1,6-alpha-mannosidase
MYASFRHVFLSQLCLFVCAGYALDIDLTNPDSVKAAAKAVVGNIISIYNGNSSTGIPGVFGQPYYWWESGLAWDSLINYWALTGDGTYNDAVSEGLLFQVSPAMDFMPANQTKSEGNDDQSTWALAVMTAAENSFPAPASANGTSWLQLAENVFNSQVARWDDKTCAGGLRWQIFTFNNGYNYKNTLSSGNLMQLAARLAKYTGNQTYTDWAEKISQWSFEVGLVQNETYSVYDGTQTTSNCTSINRIQWTANLGTYLSAYAYLANAV